MGLKFLWAKVKGVFSPPFLNHFIVSLILVTPVAVYIHTFGKSLSMDHTRWAEMGSAMAGIYGPILAAFAFWILAVQLRIQQQTTKHMFDQACISETRSDISFYLAKLETLLAGMQDGQTVGDQLKARFELADVDQLKHRDFIAAAKHIHAKHPLVCHAWVAFQGAISSLRAGNELGYQAAASAAGTRASVTLSWAACVALDHYVWCYTEGLMRGPYLFSDLDQLRASADQ